jgi:hypothetical protein
MIVGADIRKDSKRCAQETKMERDSRQRAAREGMPELKRQLVRKSDARMADESDKVSVKRQHMQKRSYEATKTRSRSRAP